MSMNTPPVETTIDIRECDVSGCLDGRHTFVNDKIDEEHHSQQVGDGSPGHQLWVVTGYRDEKLNRWQAHVQINIDETYGVDGLMEFERFMVAYRAVQRHCERLNALEGDYL